MENTIGAYLMMKNFSTADIKRKQLVNVLKAQTCVLGDCAIKVGDIARVEKAYVSGDVLEFYACIACLDEWASENEGLIEDAENSKPVPTMLSDLQLKELLDNAQKLDFFSIDSDKGITVIETRLKTKIKSLSEE